MGIETFQLTVRCEAKELYHMLCRVELSPFAHPGIALDLND